MIVIDEHFREWLPSSLEINELGPLLLRLGTVMVYYHLER
jgi:hypothetical protein